METQPIGSDDVRNNMKEHSKRMHHKIDAESLRQMLREVRNPVFFLSIQLICFYLIITEMSSSYERIPSNEI